MPTPITLASPLPAADLLFASMSTSTGLSVLGETRLDLLSEKPDLKPEDLLGKAVTVKVETASGTPRYFNGYVTRFGLGVHRGRYYAYQATVHPWLWFLSCTADCRIFQDETVPDIVKKVFEDHVHRETSSSSCSAATASGSIASSIARPTYNFVMRLLEHEGIYWYFEHTDGHHKLVLVDSLGAHDAAPDCESLPYIERDGHGSPDTECRLRMERFATRSSTGKIASTSYDFERPSTEPQGQVPTRPRPQVSPPEYEIFDFQGDYVQRRPTARSGPRTASTSNRRSFETLRRDVERTRYRGRPPARR